MIEMDTRITQFGVRTERFSLCENHRRSPSWLAGWPGHVRPARTPGDVQPAGNLPKSLPPCIVAFRTHQWDPQTPGTQCKRGLKWRILLEGPADRPNLDRPTHHFGHLLCHRSRGKETHPYYPRAMDFMVARSNDPKGRCHGLKGPPTC